MKTIYPPIDNTPMINTIMPRKHNWSLEEIDILKSLYERTPRQELISILCLNWRVIQRKASLLKLKRSQSHGDLRPLLETTNNTAYWLGFLMADGNFSQKHGRISLGISIDDLDHAYIFADYIGGKVHLKKVNDKNRPGARDQVRISVADKLVVDQLFEKYSLNNNKTEFPPNISSFVGDYFTSFILGFIDGDGCVYKETAGGYVMCHGNWLTIFMNMNDHLLSLGLVSNSVPYLNRRGYAVWNLNQSRLIFLKKHGLEFDLPMLDRKWSRVVERKRGRPRKIH